MPPYPPLSASPTSPPQGGRLSASFTASSTVIMTQVRIQVRLRELVVCPVVMNQQSSTDMPRQEQPTPSERRCTWIPAFAGMTEGEAGVRPQSPPLRGRCRRSRQRGVKRRCTIFRKKTEKTYPHSPILPYPPPHRRLTQTPMGSVAIWEPATAEPQTLPRRAVQGASKPDRRGRGAQSVPMAPPPVSLA